MPRLGGLLAGLITKCFAEARGQEVSSGCSGAGPQLSHFGFVEVLP